MASLLISTAARLLLTAGLATSVICVLIVARNIFWHPLSHFPGPKLGAATSWYTTYYEVWKDGALVSHLAELHQRYGQQNPSANFIQTD